MGVLKLHLVQSPKSTEIKVLKAKIVEKWKYLFITINEMLQQTMLCSK